MRKTLLGAVAVLALAACSENAANDAAAEAPAEDVDVAAAESAPAPAAAAPAAPPAAPLATGPGPLPGWMTQGDAVWTMEGDELVGRGAESGVSFIATEQSYTDFNITLEFMVSNPGNSGVYFRCDDIDMPLDTTCYEANIFDDRPDQSGRTGAIVNIAPPAVEIDGQDGAWHTYDITVQGGQITVVLDGQTTVDVEDMTHTNPSPVGLQVGQGENTVRFRNISITEL
jgi:hypothetical protein